MSKDIKYHMDGGLCTYTNEAHHEQLSHRADKVRNPLFWSFPRGRGSMQPWRRKLWDHRNK
ncbi:hypothetical protein [Paenibacillus sp. sgz500958]|uniref:hypothetical protein n=1 Tax=Paenibacillus sp. sgz500958 TaxID=3242475 RepID=UPI0036D42714